MPTDDSCGAFVTQKMPVPHSIMTATLALVLVTRVVVASDDSAAKPIETLQFRLSYDAALQPEPFSGRVYVMLNTRLDVEPRMGLGWVNPPPVFAIEARGWKSSEHVVLDDPELAFPYKMGELPAGKYRVQAVARRNLDTPRPGRGAGDLYSVPRIVEIDPAKPQRIELHLDQVVEAPSPPSDKGNVRHVEIVSRLLSAFHGREIKLRAAVTLPKAYADHPEARYPTLYTVTGFGGAYTRQARMMSWVAGRHGAAESLIHVVPDAMCYRGHHAFADSANNGPWGRALIEELIPHIETEFRALRGGGHRYVTGVSSGGWSALWLQVAYPEAFNGCYAHTPDPVDFRDFQRINIYARGANMYRDGTGERRPLMRGRGDEVLVWYDDFAHMEEVLGPGGQLHSFEACFGPKGPDGEPLKLWDRKTGAVDAAVAKSWEPYDIRLVLERNWPVLKSKLAGKLHVYAGGEDNFYLEGAVRLLKESLAKLGSDAEVEIFPDLGHGMVLIKIGPMFERIASESPVQGITASPSAEGGTGILPVEAHRVEPGAAENSDRATP